MIGEYNDFPPTGENEPLEPERLILSIRDLYKAALHTDAQELRRAVEIAESGFSVEARIFIVPRRADEIVLEKSHQLLWRPRVQDGQIKEITARIPLIPSKAIKKPRGVKYWNDIFIQIGREDNQTYNYLLNGCGLTPFKDGEALIYDTEKDAEGVEYGKTADLFRVEVIDNSAPLLGASELFLILKGSELQRQLADK